MSLQTRALKEELETIGHVEELTEVFQNTASIKIREIRRKVLNSKVFFNDLWGIYQQVRVESPVSLRDKAKNDKQLIIFIASPTGLSGASDLQVMSRIKQDYSAAAYDVVVIGSHGLSLLRQNNIQPIRSFETPDIAQTFTVEPILDLVETYQTTIAYFDSYVSLTQQRPTKLELLLEPQQLTEEERTLMREGGVEVIAAGNFIFEPSVDEAILTLEQAMLSTTITQLLFESRLSQLASRFTSMTIAHDRARTEQKKTFYRYLAARRSERDEMSRQIGVAAKMRAV